MKQAVRYYMILDSAKRPMLSTLDTSRKASWEKFKFWHDLEREEARAKGYKSDPVRLVIERKRK